jgi:hypothetical protein
MRSPDASWVRRERWDALSADEREKFPPLRPDFVVELRSPSDRLPMLQKRLRELIRNGAQLGWLIDPQRRLVHVYRPGEAVQSLLAPVTISAESCSCQALCWTSRRFCSSRRGWRLWREGQIAPSRPDAFLRCARSSSSLFRTTCDHGRLSNRATVGI